MTRTASAHPRAISVPSGIAWGLLILAGAAVVLFTATQTYFAQDDFGWLLRTRGEDPTPFWGPRFLSMHLWFRLLMGMFGPNPLAFHLGLAFLAATLSLLIFFIVARHLKPIPSACVALLVITSPVLFVAVHWVSVTADLMCGLFLMVALWLLTSPTPSARHHNGAVLAYALALWSKEIAVGAAPVFAWLEWRSPRRSWVRAGLFLALAVAESFAAAGPWHDPTSPYAADPAAALFHVPRYIAAVTVGPLAAHSSSEQAWSQVPWVIAAGCLLLSLWIVGLVFRRDRKAWFAAVWFLLLLMPVLPLKHQFYFYYAICSVGGFWASLMFLFTRPDAGWLRTSLAMLGTAGVVAVQSMGADAREHSKLKNADLPSDFVLRRAVIAHNVTSGIEPFRDRLRSSVAIIGDQPIQTASGGTSTTRATTYVVDPYWDVDIRSALYDGDAIRLIAPQVREVIFPRWIGSSDSMRTIIQCGIDGRPRVMSFEEYAHVPAFDPSAPLRSRMLRANRFIELRMFPDAAGELEKGAQLAPSDPTIFLNWGATLAAIGDTASAVTVLSEALKLDPGDVDVRFNLGLLEWRAGARSRAEETWAPVLRAAPQSDLGQRIRALLDDRAR
jgi:hypothetical protein